MNIQEATKIALAENKCITIPENGHIWFKIRPTNDPKNNCILLYNDMEVKKIISALSHGWQPTADELTSDDWIVTD